MPYLSRNPVSHLPLPLRSLTAGAAALLLLAGMAACGGDGGRVEASMVGAGDIAGCYWRTDEETARLLDRIDGVVFTLGDNVYTSGRLSEFARCYGPTWGRHLERTRPTPGNHEYRTKDAAAYFAYFGHRAGDAGKGWYSYDVDGWHVVALNTDRSYKAGEEQLRWLEEDLSRHRARCTLVYMHHPRYTSGKHGGRTGRLDRVLPIWEILYAHGVEVVLAGHDHHYERFAPQDPQGRLDRERGIRQFIVGTGGAPPYRLRARAANSEVVGGRARGVLKLSFSPDGYEWEFVPIPGTRFTDSGRGTCH